MAKVKTVYINYRKPNEDNDDKDSEDYDLAYELREVLSTGDSYKGSVGAGFYEGVLGTEKQQKRT